MIFNYCHFIYFTHNQNTNAPKIGHCYEINIECCVPICMNLNPWTPIEPFSVIEKSYSQISSYHFILLCSVCLKEKTNTKYICKCIENMWVICFIIFHVHCLVSWTKHFSKIGFDYSYHFAQIKLLTIMLNTCGLSRA